MTSLRVSVLPSTRIYQDTRNERHKNVELVDLLLQSMVEEYEFVQVEAVCD